MDGTQFDTLIKRLATTPVTRGSVLRGLVASVASLVGVPLAAEPGAAHEKKKDEPKRRVCLWSSTGGRTKKVARDQRRKILRRNPCARKGRCSGTNPCAAGTPVPAAGTPVPPPPGFTCTPNQPCTGTNAGLGCTEAGTACVACTASSNCGGQVCLNGRCQGGPPCPDDADCCNPENATCVSCGGNPNCRCFPRLDAPGSACVDLSEPNPPECSILQSCPEDRACIECGSLCRLLCATT